MKITCEVCEGEHPTWECCEKCNYNAHNCPGCGVGVGHNMLECPDCKDYYDSIQDNIRLGTE